MASLKIEPRLSGPGAPKLPLPLGEAGVERPELGPFPDKATSNETARQQLISLEREIVALRERLTDAERQLGHIRQTFIYRIGETVVSARTWRGLVCLPRRLLTLRQAFLARRDGAPRLGAGETRAADRLRYVDEARRIANTEGIAAAVSHIRFRPGGHGAAKSRALAELALMVCTEDPESALALGLEAARLNPEERRLRALILGLADHGESDACAALLTAVGPGAVQSPADRARIQDLAERRLARSTVR